jgi:hypothetical protein
MTKKMTALVTAVTVAMTSSGLATAKDATFTGTIGDSRCQANNKDDAACIRDCVARGAEFVLITRQDGKDKIYLLKASRDAVREALTKLANKTATITGDQAGDTIQVASVSAPKYGRLAKSRCENST